jgi:ATP-dependent DNA helicase DinG
MSRVYVALDLETTGLDPQKDAIIEIGAVRFREDQVLDTWSNLINPGQPLPLQTQRITGIDPAETAKAPPLTLVADDLQRFVGDNPLVGHNISFDLRFLRKKGLLTRNQAIDTFELASILVPHISRYSLANLTAALGISFPTQHRALADAQAARLLFLALLEQGQSIDRKIIQEIAQLSARSDWPLRHVFQDLARRVVRTAFTGGTLGQQLRAKGALEDQGAYGLLFAQVEKERPLQPAPQPRALDVESLTSLIEEGSTFSRQFPGYEYRPQQIEMLKETATAFNEGRHLMVEAGTGIGKSIAYLLPAIHWAVQNGERVVISTNTINLQEQLYHKDIPDLQAILPLDFKAAVLKGRSNYLCPHRFDLFRRRNLNKDELRVLAKILVWLPNTMTGDQSELFLPTPKERGIWQEVCANSDICSPQRCQQENCFLQRARQAAESAHIIIVNHALLLADVAVENRVLPDYRYLVIDEAHHLENSVTRQLSFSADRWAVEKLLYELKPPAGAAQRGSGFLAGLLNSCRRPLPEVAFDELATRCEEAGRRVEQAERNLHEFFGLLETFLQEHTSPGGRYDQRLRLTDAVRIQPAWSQVEISWDNLALNLGQLGDGLGRVQRLLDGLESYDIPNYEELLLDLAGYRNQWATLRGELNAIIAEPSPRAIIWAELSASDGRVSLHSAPLHVGSLVQRHLFDTKASVIMTSATLCTDEGFDFLRERLSAWDAGELPLGSPFDYASSTLLYLPTDLPEPNTSGYKREIARALIDLCQAIRGRTLVLFTSYSHLRSTAKFISQPLAEKGIIVYQQGGGTSRNQLLENFRTTEQAVLLGTRSFWEGIDVAGEALSCLVIARLPFAVPNDPIFAARSESFDEPFSEYTVPDAILRFRQGFGRLIRSKSDRGVVAIFDRRVLSKSYGQMFLNSLPPCTTRRGPVSHLPQIAARWIDGLDIPGLRG